MIITQMTKTGATGAFGVSACAEYVAQGHRVRVGSAAPAPVLKGTALSSWTVDANPTPVLIRYGGATG